MNHHVGISRNIICFLIIVWSISCAQAVELPVKKDPEPLCDDVEPEQATFFMDVREQIIEIRQMICEGDVSKEEVEQAFTDFLDTYQGKWFEKYGGFEEHAEPLQVIREFIGTDTVGKQSSILPVTVVSLDTFSVGGMPFLPASRDMCPGDRCRAVLEEFAGLYNYAQAAAEAAHVTEVLQNLNALGTQWDRYLAESRSQTPLELLVNSWNFKRHQVADRFLPPPNWQFIMLHPALIIENVEDAIAGEKTQDALMVELGGVNRWRSKYWYQLTGASIVATYADRASTDDVGYGVALHFNSAYTVGYTERNGSSGYFISIDLLKPLQDNTKAFTKFTK